ncbi:MAG: hypothetical protein M3220_07400 [Chloroflexota bacterium]|nr:hypothetical protein [Chloroflexota bacterium]
MAIWDRERITLVVEQEALRLMGVQHGRVTRWGSAPLPRTVLDEGGMVTDPAVLAQVLERLWAAQTADQSLSKGQLLLALPGHRVLTRVVSVPNLDTEDTQLMSERARAVVDQPDAYTAWQVVGRGNEATLFVAAAPRPLVDGYVRALERAGLGLAAIDVKPLALIRGIGARHAIIVDVERTLGTVIIVDEAVPRRVRFQPFTFPLLTSPEDKVMRLGEVIYLTVRAYNQEADAHVLHPAVPVFLTGSLSDHVFFHDMIRDVLGHPIGHVEPPIEVPPDMPLGQFIANLGLAQKQL